MSEVAQVVLLSEEMGLHGAFQEQGDDVAVVTLQAAGGDQALLDPLRHSVGGEVANPPCQFLPVDRRRKRLHRWAVPGGSRRGRGGHHQRNQAILRLVAPRHAQPVDELRDVVAPVLVPVGGDVPAHVAHDQLQGFPLRNALCQQNGDRLRQRPAVAVVEPLLQQQEVGVGAP